MMRNFLGAIALYLGFIFPAQAMPFDPLIGTWKVIDDHKGHYVAEIVIRKNSKTSEYSAVITRNLLSVGTIQLEVCSKCQGNLKNQPIKGMQALEGLVANSNPKQFSQGQLSSPEFKTPTSSRYNLPEQCGQIRFAPIFLANFKPL